MVKEKKLACYACVHVRVRGCVRVCLYVCVCARAYVCEWVRVFKYLILFQGHSADVQPGPYFFWGGVVLVHKRTSLLAKCITPPVFFGLCLRACV
jgi:hypothetical protein